jgi:hypothetical protein
MKAMKRLLLVLVFLAITMPSASETFDVEEVIDAINITKPNDWQVIKDYNDRPSWIRTGNTCLRMTLYGPALGGYRYLNASGNIIEEDRDTHEAVTVWITPKGFKTGWNPLTRVLNWLAPWGPIHIPPQIADFNGVGVYAEESYYRPSEKIKIDSPKGAVTAVFCPPPCGRTWQNWQTEIKQTIKNLSPTNKSTRPRERGA